MAQEIAELLFALFLYLLQTTQQIDLNQVERVDVRVAFHGPVEPRDGVGGVVLSAEDAPG